MKATEILLNHVYAGTDGRTRKVMELRGKVRSGAVRYRSAGVGLVWCAMKHFRAWAQEDVTQPNAGIVKQRSK